MTSNGSELAPVCCPACGSQCSQTPLYRYTASQAAAHFCPVTRDKDRNRRLRECIRRLWNSDDCVVLRCRDCGFAFGFPFIGGDEDFYAILHEQKDYPAWRWDYDIAITRAINLFDGGRILDIGAGVGMFLRRLGSEWEPHAVEGSESTRRELEAAGVTVFRNLMEAARSEAGTFQVVTLFQVLEHVANFDPLLEECRQLLATGGRLIITVPDADAMIRQERLTGCPDMPPNHIGKWSPESLSRVLQRVGFQVSEPICEPPSWLNVKASLHMKVMSNASRGRSLAAQVYRIQNKRLRVLGLACLGVPALLVMLPNISQLRLGGAFAMVGVAR